MIQTGMKTMANANSISAISRSQETRRLGKEDLSAIAICIPSERIVNPEHHTVNAATHGSNPHKGWFSVTSCGLVDRLRFCKVAFQLGRLCRDQNAAWYTPSLHCSAIL